MGGVGSGANGMSLKSMDNMQVMISSYFRNGDNSGAVNLYVSE